MDFIEETTPKGNIIKILLKKWQFMAYTAKGASIYADEEGKKLLHHIPLILFLGKTIKTRGIYDNEYHLLKVRDNYFIIPFFYKPKDRIQYMQISTPTMVDLLPARIYYQKNIAELIKSQIKGYLFDYIIIDESITDNDIIILKNRFKEAEIIHIFDQIIETTEAVEEETRDVNLNMLSTNPVFLAGIHLRNMDLSMVNQLLLDFELTALDTEYIISFLKKEHKDASEENSPKAKHREMLTLLLDSFTFYMYLLRRDDEEVERLINSRTSIKELAPFRTMVQKAKSQFPGREEQKLYTGYEEIVMNRRATLKEGS